MSVYFRWAGPIGFLAAVVPLSLCQTGRAAREWAVETWVTVTAVPEFPCAAGVSEITPCNKAVDTAYGSALVTRSVQLENKGPTDVSYELSCVAHQPLATCNVSPSSARVFGYSSIGVDVQYSASQWPSREPFRCSRYQGRPI
jgi:hypothetical protein